MDIQVNREICEGCSLCISECPAGAISLFEGIAEIDKALCTQCQVCIEACPVGAITVIAQPIPQNINAIQVVPAQDTIIEEPVLPSSPYRFSSVLSSIGSAILPRLVNVLINAFEQHLTQGDNKLPSLTSQNSVDPVRHGRRRYQHRIQGRRQ